MLKKLTALMLAVVMSCLMAVSASANPLKPALRSSYIGADEETPNPLPTSDFWMWWNLYGNTDFDLFSVGGLDKTGWNG